MLKLFVRNLPWDATAADLEIFLATQGYGKAEVKIVESPEDGRSRGFGFVTFADEASCETALRGLEGCDFTGRELHVALAFDKQRGGLGRGRADSSRAGGSRAGGSRAGGSRAGGSRAGGSRAGGSRGRSGRGGGESDEWGWES